MRTTLLMLLLLTACSTAMAQPVVPDREIPPRILAQVRVLDNRFEVALAADCDSSRCFPKGCTYVDHVVADRPRSTSLPGLGQDPGPSAAKAQEYLTAAHCAFTHENTVPARDVATLTQRLQDKLSSGWTVTTVSHQRLSPLPAYLQDPPEEPPEEVPEEDEDTDAAPEPEPVAEPPFTLGSASYELWSTLLPHFFWMIAVLMVTIAGIVLIWVWRRVGRETLEEKMLAAELAHGVAPEPSQVVVEVDEDRLNDELFVEQQRQLWGERLDTIDEEHPDLVLQALIRERLAARDLPLLAKAVLTFPDQFPPAFPDGAVGGELATAKLALSDYLRDMEVDELPDDSTFFQSLNRHTLASAVACQSDARTMRSLREEFGTTGLATLLVELPARPAALLFALAPATSQHELVRIVEPDVLAAMADALLRSNRMSPAENDHLSAILDAARRGEAPPPGAATDVSDRGEAFDAAAPLSTLLEGLRPERRSALFEAALERLHGRLAAWTRGVLISDMLQTLQVESRADLLLELDVRPLAAWLSLLDSEAQERVLRDMPTALQASVRASTIFPSREQMLTLAARGRQELARGFQAQLARAGIAFERVVVQSEA